MTHAFAARRPGLACLLAATLLLAACADEPTVPLGGDDGGFGWLDATDPTRRLG